MREAVLKEAYRYCEWITYRHYENFPVASRFLPKAIRPHIAAIYAFARSADDFADERRYRGRSLALLENWRCALMSSTDGDTPKNPFRTHPIFIALSDTIRRYRLPVELLDDLLKAFSLDVTKRRYADWDDLMGYCRLSANPVGRLVLTVFGIQDPLLHTYSDRICTALQLTNHWQDLRIDLARDILYVPKTFLKRYGVSEYELVSYLEHPSPPPTPSYRAMMRDLVDRTRRLFEEGASLWRHLKGGLKWEVHLTWLGGMAILDRIEAVGYDVFRKRPTLSNGAKVGLVCRAFLFR